MQKWIKECGTSVCTSRPLFSFNACVSEFLFSSTFIMFCLLSPELSSFQQLPEPQQCDQHRWWQRDPWLSWDQWWRGPLPEAVLHPVPGLRVDLAAEGQPWRQLQNHHGCQWVPCWGWFCAGAGTVPQREGRGPPFHHGSLRGLGLFFNFPLAPQPCLLHTLATVRPWARWDMPPTPRTSSTSHG